MLFREHNGNDIISGSSGRQKVDSNPEASIELQLKLPSLPDPCISLGKHEAIIDKSFLSLATKHVMSTISPPLDNGTTIKSEPIEKDQKETAMVQLDPATCVFVSTTRDHPIHLWDAVTGQVIRGLIMDKERGNLVRADRFGYVKRAMHGTNMLSTKAVRWLILRWKCSDGREIPWCFSIILQVAYTQVEVLRW
ncbi:uncharacterized protein A4U43_C03F18650 [Asparagus officinalis]|uniref:Uncharacterized protein n=1 Tax=Asparagus officinalis TaxID=4686 RepID=A0A5P1FB80_ASPOF|nr:uncharacterized protein A4U43_C03F18650 [Asparagus officinalis]